ncbi:MAG: N-acetylmuramoyl-L-alanine amidase [Clostridia bacterium]|nr:N-acetylmuramoyl-L-alanine amidase [Clostridia bacterium]
MKKGLYLILNVKLIAGLTASLFALVIIFTAFAAGKSVTAGNFNSTAKPIIIIDAGHGGEDGGPQSADGILEKDINLSVSLKLNKILTRYGFKTVMIRDTDKLIYDEGSDTVRKRKSSDLHNRMDIMKKYDGCIFLSIHQNHFSESKYNGAQVFYCKSQRGSDVLADCIQKSIVNSLQKDNTRLIKPCTSSVYLIYNAVSTAVMVECGFLSNAEEAEKLNDNTYQYEMALAIAKGLVNFVNTKGS